MQPAGVQQVAAFGVRAHWASNKRDAAAVEALAFAQYSLRGFSVGARAHRDRVVGDADVARRAHPLAARRRPLLDCVYAPDQPPLRALFEAAREAVAWQRPSEAYVRVRHACRGMTAHEFLPVEFKACSDGPWLYCVALDAHMPARLEGMLPDYLLSTSAFSLLTWHSRSNDLRLIARRQVMTFARRARRSKLPPRCFLPFLQWRQTRRRAACCAPSTPRAPC